MQAEGASSTVVTTPIGGEHLDNIGELNFSPPSFGSHMQCSLDLVVPYQMFHRLHCVI
jgi:hypothetical protein